MWSIWNAPSDRDYYDSYGDSNQDDEPKYCGHCGARRDQACEEWCCTNAPASEPEPTEGSDGPVDAPQDLVFPNARSSS